LQPDLLADDVATLIGHYGAQCADVLGFSYGGGIAIRVVNQHPSVVRRLILASTTAYRNQLRDQQAPADDQRRVRPRPTIAWDDPELTGPGAPDGALSRAMAYAGAPADIWRLDRLADWHSVLARVAFSSDWNVPHARGQLRPGCPADAETVLRDWAGPVLILHGTQDATHPVSHARKLHLAVPASTLAEIQDAAHMAHFDDPRAWLAEIRRFLTLPSTYSPW
jgi:pimeloyl-ACP methyl ester carboxylesterase